MTVTDIMKMSLSLIGVLADGEDADTSMLNSALAFFKIMLNTWSADNLIIPVISRDTFTSLPQTQVVTIGPSMDLPLPICPIAVEGITITGSDEVNYDLIPIAEEVIRSQSNTLINVIPKYYSFLQGDTTASILFSSSPSSGLSISIRSLKPFDTSFSLTDNVILPPAYQMPIVYGLSVLLSPKYGKRLDQTIAAAAVSSYDMVKNRNSHLRESPPMRMDAGMPGVCRYPFNRGY